MNGEWYPFKISDDNWNKFLNGEAFDVISMAKSVKAHAFEDNSLLRRVIMPECENVYEYAFKGSSIRELSMPKLERAWEYSFAETTNWVPNTTLDLPALETIDNNAFRGIYLGSGNPVYMNIENVETIGATAFYESGSITFLPYEGPLKDLILPKCTSIGDSAFSCFYSYLSQAFHNIILDSIETIGDSVFHRNEFKADANNHATVRFGPNITSIGSSIFSTTSDLGSRGTDPTYGHNIYGDWIDLYIEAVNPPSLAGFFNSAMVQSTTLVESLFPNIYVPEESVNVYKTHSAWSRYADYIQAIPTT